jgi:glycine oxidase
LLLLHPYYNDRVKAWDVIIAGAGIIGVSAALELRERGTQVLVLDKGEPGREASSAAAGMLAAADPETPPALRPLAIESARLFPEYVRKLVRVSGIAVDFRRQGTIAFLECSSQLTEYRTLASEELHRIEPALQAGRYASYFVREDSVDPDLLMQAALQAARNGGIEVRGHTSVQELRVQGTRIEVRTSTGSYLAAAVVNCRGAWSGAPVKPRKGQMLYLRPQRMGLLEHVVRAPEVYFVPRSSGKILVGATVEDVGFDKGIQPEIIQKLYIAATQYLPELALAVVTESWAGLRPGSPDDLPLIGPTEIPGIFVASGHFRNGILLAPITAQIVADLVTGKAARMDIAAFSPGRFAATKP